MATYPSVEKPFFIDRAKLGRATCRKCKEKCRLGELRIAKFVPSPFGTGKMKTWYHVHCMFEQFLSQRVTTKRIESFEDLDGWDTLEHEDQDELQKTIEDGEKDFAKKHGQNYTPKKVNNAKPLPYKSPINDTNATNQAKGDSSSKKVEVAIQESDENTCYFREFRRLVSHIGRVDSYTDKTNIVKNYFTKGDDGKGFKGNVTQWCRLLLPGVIKRIYNLQNKQLIKLFSKIFSVEQQVMTDSLNQGDIGDTIQAFFDQCTTFKPLKRSVLPLQEVDDFLEELSRLTKEDDQLNHFRSIARKCTSYDLKIIIRLIKHDLRINAGAKHILQGVHPEAYDAYQASRDLDTVIKHFTGESSKDTSSTNKPGINIMTPIQPMLAEACKSVEQAMKKCPNGIYSEIKYDGERVQVHKYGSQFKYYSRSLKPVLHHKIAHFEQYIPKAFPQGSDLILDSEILMMDHETNQPLPFGTLGVHKKSEFKNANVCLFVFDCIYYNGESLMHKPLDYRKKILKENMTEIPNRVVLAEMEFITTSKQLSSMIARVLQLGLEGLVLKDIKSVYEPGKRHWLKVKKDYLLDGAMADTADLIVLGAWYGTGRKAGMKSVFLMGCYDKNTNQYYTVTKVHTGHDDKTLEKLQKELQMEEIGCNYKKVPNWLNCNKQMTPDFVARDPKTQPVWEITGAEFTQHEVHTADGISIRFPRVTRIRSDKTWETATTLQELKNLFKTSKESTDFKTLMAVDDDDDDRTLESLRTSKNVSNKPIIAANDTGVSPQKVQKINDKIEESPNSKSTSNKHKLSTDDAEMPPTKVEKTDNKPNKAAVRIDDLAKKIKNPLLNIFKDVLLLLEEGAKEVFEKWLRYFVAYGGTVIDSTEWLKATHVLHLEHSITKQTIQCPKHARHIILEWIKDSIANNKLQDCVPYTVRWEPE